MTINKENPRYKIDSTVHLASATDREGEKNEDDLKIENKNEKNRMRSPMPFSDSSRCRILLHPGE